MLRAVRFLKEMRANTLGNEMELIGYIIPIRKLSRIDPDGILGIVHP